MKTIPLFIITSVMSLCLGLIVGALANELRQYQEFDGLDDEIAEYDSAAL